jgi:hypothetical protein
VKARELWEQAAAEGTPGGRLCLQAYNSYLERMKFEQPVGRRSERPAFRVRSWQLADFLALAEKGDLETGQLLAEYHLRAGDHKTAVKWLRRPRAKAIPNPAGSWPGLF